MSKQEILQPGERCDSRWCEVRRSGIHGRGLFAKRRIPQGTSIIEYVGERIDKEESNRRGWARIAYAKRTGDAAVYIFTLDDEHDIDGDVPENAARLINHSCAPNCEAYIEGGKIWIGALRDIERDEELFYNYGFDLESWDEHPCRCGSARCVGYIAGEEHWPALKRLIARRKAAGAKGSKKRPAKGGSIVP
jgi:SET domain-containing protein